jgi:hypothetical protein
MAGFRKAERSKAKLRLALCGPSGSGKTFSALLLAQGLAPGGKIALIDTERGSGELYADLCDYDVCPLEDGFSPRRYVALINDAAQAGYDVLIIDSLSHAWSGEGGALDMVDKAAKASRSGNSFAAWREVTPEHNRLVDAILSAPMHVIVTMRTKTAYEVVENDKGRKAPVKIGLAPVQKEGMEYEFTAVLDLSVDGHVATASKDRTRLFDGRHEVLSAAIGTELLAWLNTGKDTPPPAPAPAKTTPTLTPEQERVLLDQLKSSATDTRNALDNAIGGAGEIEVKAEMESWWKKNQPSIRTLSKAGQAELNQYCKQGAQP